MSGELIFVVDDDDAVRASLRAVLETAGYRTTVFESGIAFLDFPHNPRNRLSRRKADVPIRTCT